MKKYIALFLSLLCLLSTSALAAGDGFPHYDLLDETNPAFAVSAAPDSWEAPTQNAQAEPAGPIDASGDAPVDESTYREEPPAVYTPVERLPGRGNIDDIYDYWEQNGYPGDVSYAYQGGGEMIGGEIYSWWEIALVGSDPARQQEILDLVSPTCLVEFKNALFSHAEKVAAYDALTELATTDPNIRQIIFMRNDDTVWVAIPEELAKDYARYLIRDLGLGAVVSVTDEGSIGAATENSAFTGIAPGGRTPGSAPDIGPETGGTGASAGVGGAVPAGLVPRLTPLIWVCGAVAVLAATLTVLALRRRAPVAVTAQGTAVHAAAPLTRRQVAGLVAERNEVPDAGLYTAILNRLEEAQTDSN